MDNTQIKIMEELNSVEDLVFQIRYFADKSFDIKYSAGMITNLSKQLLNLLRVEHSDIKHLFVQEARWQHKPFSFKKKLSHLHKTINQKESKIIKNEVKKIVSECRKASKKTFCKQVDKSCSKILKALKSEHHELKLVKNLLKI